MRRSLQLTALNSLKLLASTAVIFSTMMPLAYALDLPDGAKQYYKDRVSSSPGLSEGVGPTKKPDVQKGVEIGRRESKGFDFGDESSGLLTMKSWEALNKKDGLSLMAYTSRCIELYEARAKEEQAALKDFAPSGSEKGYPYLNDIAVCYFIQGEFYKYKKEFEKAKSAYKKVVVDFGFSQYWDPRGWWWKPGEISKGEIEKIDAGYYYEK